MFSKLIAILKRGSPAALLLALAAASAADTPAPPAPIPAPDPNTLQQLQPYRSPSLMSKKERQALQQQLHDSKLADNEVIRRALIEEAKEAEKAVKESQKAAAKEASKDAQKTLKDALAKDKGKGAGKRKIKPADAAAAEDAGTADAKPDEEPDSIEMLNGYKIPGKIHKELPDAVILMSNNDNARIRIPKDKIRNINYSMATRMGALAEDDYEGKYKVGLWAMEKGMYPQVIELFESIKNEEAVSTTDILKNLGRAYEQRGQLDKALETYEDYLKGHDDDTEVAETVKRLGDEVRPKEPEAKIAAAAKIVDGLEGDGTWVDEKWPNANPGTVQFTTDKKGNKMIFVDSPGGPKDKMAFSRNGQPLNLSDSKEMVFKIFNAGDTPINLAAAFVNAQGDFHESKQLRINAKTWSDQSIKVDGKVFKSNRNDFKEWNLDLQGKENITRITFMVYGQRPFKLYLDGLFFK